jgi:hypothetical protein
LGGDCTDHTRLSTPPRILIILLPSKQINISRNENWQFWGIGGVHHCQRSLSAPDSYIRLHDILFRRVFDEEIYWTGLAK